MKNWNTLEPDQYRLMNKHFTPGRGGQTIDKVVIHHNAGVLSIDQIWAAWQDRQASAHYQVEVGGRIGQLVNDWDTAWHAANLAVNQSSIGIEFANSAGAGADWPISDKTIEEGAHLVAAICRHYKLGRPTAGTNVRFHREFTQTACPYHLAPGGKYHNTLMSRARYWYDQMSKPGGGLPSAVKPTLPGGSSSSSSTSSSKESSMSDRLILDQLVGPETDSKGNRKFTGWPQTKGKTFVDYQVASNEELMAGMRELKHDFTRVVEELAKVTEQLAKTTAKLEEVSNEVSET